MHRVHARMRRAVTPEEPTATPLFGWLRGHLGWPDGGTQVPVLYGGSVTSANIGEFLAEPAIDGALVSMSSGTTQLLTDLQPGDHLLQVEFVANDHAPFDPRVLAAVTFEARG